MGAGCKVSAGVHGLPACTEACCLSGPPHTPGLMLGAAAGKHLTNTHWSHTGGFRSENPGHAGYWREVGVPREEATSLKLSGHWTGAHVKATALGACVLGKLSGHLPTPFTQATHLRGGIAHLCPLPGVLAPPWVSPNGPVQALEISLRDSSLLSILGWSLHPGAGLQFRILAGRAEENWRGWQFPGGEKGARPHESKPQQPRNLDSLARFPQES